MWCRRCYRVDRIVFSNCARMAARFDVAYERSEEWRRTVQKRLPRPSPTAEAISPAVPHEDRLLLNWCVRALPNEALQSISAVTHSLSRCILVSFPPLPLLFLSFAAPMDPRYGSAVPSLTPSLHIRPSFYSLPSRQVCIPAPLWWRLVMVYIRLTIYHTIPYHTIPYRSCSRCEAHRK